MRPSPFGEGLLHWNDRALLSGRWQQKTSSIKRAAFEPLDYTQVDQVLGGIRVEGGFREVGAPEIERMNDEFARRRQRPSCHRGDSAKAKPKPELPFFYVGCVIPMRQRVDR